ncbi:hypothetical protein [Nannocystis punicea]|uniref:Uncharacterized protein n=1 Tax=Nannocystis punicea TaxID=2995304 RepID=A0ABY7GU39_9BACT|nr:hypothetical protein [Nannocystis poenicansa]WAS90410.1 hypothetical protein O0S08_29835 [Nannocystis poenicansa]
MTEQREYATRTNLHAFYSHSQLLIVAEGELPSTEYEIDIGHQAGEAVPTFALTHRARPTAANTPPKATPFRYGEIFSIGRPPDVIRVRHKGGLDDVSVEFTRDDLVDIVLSLSGGDVEVSLPDEGDTNAPIPPPPPSGFDTIPPTIESSAPVETRPLTASEKAGILGDIAVRYREAIGYSNKLSFDEAFADALKKLPPPSVKFPDMLETVEVVQIGASFGGIAGFRRLEVRIRAYPD